MNTSNKENIKEWRNSLGSKVLVVGNGKLHFPVPDMEYDSVIRINNFELGLEAGSRVTHWVTSAYKDVQSRPLPNALMPWCVSSKAAQHKNAFEFRTGRSIVATRDNYHIKTWFPACDQSWHWFPSTGFCLIALLFKWRVKPSIIGFDGMATGHYWNPNHIHDHVQTKELEYHIIQKICEIIKR